MRISGLTKGFALAGITVTALAMGQTTATAAEVVEQPTAESVAALQSELEGEGIAPTVTDAGGVLTKQYEVDTPEAPRVVIETTEPGTVAPGTISPQFSVGVGNGIYVYLNNAEQQAVIAGGANGLAYAVCAVPAVGTVACGATLTAFNAAAAYINARGAVCPGQLEINYLDFPNPGPSFKCV